MADCQPYGGEEVKRRRKMELGTGGSSHERVSCGTGRGWMQRLTVPDARYENAEIASRFLVVCSRTVVEVGPSSIPPVLLFVYPGTGIDLPKATLAVKCVIGYGIHVLAARSFAHVAGMQTSDRAK